MILAPATMGLLGDANWWLPRWLRWLPVIHIDDNETAPSDLDAELAHLTPETTSVP